MRSNTIRYAVTVRIVQTNGAPDDFSCVTIETDSDSGELHVLSAPSGEWMKTYAKGQWVSVRDRDKLP